MYRFDFDFGTILTTPNHVTTGDVASKMAALAAVLGWLGASFIP